MPILAINVGEGEGMTEVRFVFCDAGKDVRWIEKGRVIIYRE